MTMIIYKSPVGYFEINSDGEHITSIQYTHTDMKKYSREPICITEAQCMRELEEYFTGKRKKFTVRTKLPVMSDFMKKIMLALKGIPYGKTATYGQLAEKAGSPRAARAVGTVMKHNPIPIIYPCHRIVASGGKPGGFGMGLDIKRTLLEREGCTL